MQWGQILMGEVFPPRSLKFSSGSCDHLEGAVQNPRTSLAPAPCSQLHLPPTPAASEMLSPCSRVQTRCKKHPFGERGSVGSVFSKSLCNGFCKGSQHEWEPRKTLQPCCLLMETTPHHRENHHGRTGQKELPPAWFSTGKAAANTTPPG